MPNLVWHLARSIAWQDRNGHAPLSCLVKTPRGCSRSAVLPPLPRAAEIRVRLQRSLHRFTVRGQILLSVSAGN